MRTIALTLDLDGPSEYAGIHGVNAAHADPLMMYGRPLARFVELCESLGGVGSLFAIGRDVRDQAVPALRDAAARGFEIGNHSSSHDYALSLRSAAAGRPEIERAQQVIAERVGVVPRGFRAPGYHVSPALFDTLAELGFSYDSSVLPSPSYYAAKAAVLGYYRICGRASTSILGSPAMAFAATAPYRPGLSPFAKGQRPFWELPITVASPGRLPITGATLVMAPRFLTQIFLRSLTRRDVIIVNLHAMDFVDPILDALPTALAARQPELRVPVHRRLDRFRAFFATLIKDRTLATSGAIASALQEDAHPC